MEKTFIPFKTIKGCSKELSKYLYSLFISITNVDESYIHYNGENKTDDFEHVERVFAYELYRQWCDCPLIQNNKQLVINAELPKSLIREVRVKDENLTYPDLVLHKGQNEFEGNLIICEIKRASYAQQHKDKLLEDFNKLNKYLSKDFKANVENKKWEPFKIGVFIMTEDPQEKSLSVNRIVSFLEDKLNRNIIADETMKRIFCIVYNGKELKYDSLYNMLNEK